MRNVASIILILTCHFSIGQEIRRKASLGAAITDSPDKIGCTVSKIIPGGTAENLNIKEGDKIIHIGRIKITDRKSCAEAINQYRAGDTLSLIVLRENATIRLFGNTQAKPLETDDNSTVIYDQVAYKKGLLRVIINRPKSETKIPAVLIIPGYTCSSIDNLTPEHPYKRIVDGFVDAGYVTLRVEKSGLGDSYNTPPCESCDLLDEIENFKAGLKKLKSLPYVDTNKIILFGHSMGGIVAPAISATEQVAGVIVYGTTAKSWFDYQIEIIRTQKALEGVNPVEIEKLVNKNYELNYRFFIQKEKLSELAKKSYLDSLLKSDWTYDGKGAIFGRNAEYWRQIQDIPHLQNWSNTRAKVLVLFGESDFQAFSKADHQLIVNAVNYTHPNNATLVTFPETDHYFAKSGTMQQAWDLFIGGKTLELFQAYNPKVHETCVKWSNTIIGKHDNQQLNESTNSPWKKMNTEKYAGKQDDICFVDEKLGWYVNGYGNIYHTKDGGLTWKKQLEQKGTFFRCIGFADSLLGFAGTVGTDYFPGVTDTIPLYKTIDGGKTWKPVDYSGPIVKGLCAIDIVKTPFINHGKIDYKIHVYAVGRVGSPAFLLTSHDNGMTWSSRPVKKGKMLFDIDMFNEKEGIACSADNADLTQSHALILRTTNGGKTWKKVYTSKRNYETTWKVHFSSKDTGYATIQSYNPDPTINQQHIIKTTDGGKTWLELPLVQDSKARPFGIGFIDNLHGFVGTMNVGYETRDGGNTWHAVDMGKACNKIRFYQFTPNKIKGVAIGVDVLNYSPN